MFTLSSYRESRGKSWLAERGRGSSCALSFKGARYSVFFFIKISFATDLPCNQILGEGSWENEANQVFHLYIHLKVYVNFFNFRTILCGTVQTFVAEVTLSNAKFTALDFELHSILDK